MTHRRAIGLLILVALVWGSSFTLTKAVLASTSPLVYMGLRFAIATAPIAGTFRRLRRAELLAGSVLGILFWAGFVLQTKGLELTTSSRSAFLTSLSSTLTPVVALLVYRAAPGRLTLAGIGAATVGMFLLTAPDGSGGINMGDVLTVGCALLFAGQIVAAAAYTRRFDPLHLLTVQLGLTAVLSIVSAPFLETPRLVPLPGNLALIGVLALTGLWSFYMQLRAQSQVSASTAALVFLLEPVFATIVSFLTLGERFTPLQWVGAAVILLALALPAASTLRRSSPPGPPADATEPLHDPDIVNT
jgi:drug/metabolite transporter (DMT)-like permease